MGFLAGSVSVQVLKITILITPFNRENLQVQFTKGTFLMGEQIGTALVAGLFSTIVALIGCWLNSRWIEDIKLIDDTLKQLEGRYPEAERALKDKLNRIVWAHSFIHCGEKGKKWQILAWFGYFVACFGACFIFIDIIGAAIANGGLRNIGLSFLIIGVCACIPFFAFLWRKRGDK